MTDPPHGSLKTLIVVTGHAVYSPSLGTPLEDRAWCLESPEYGEPPLLTAHVKRGVDLALEHQDSLLVFSGGQTRPKAGPQSEAQGYWRVAEFFNWWDADGIEHRATTEEYARDSFENLLYSTCRFREWTAGYPDHTHVISWEFKRARFDLIRKALRIPEAAYSFVGVNQPPDPAAAALGESKAVAAITLDPYGVGPVLGAKRDQRNPFRRTAPYPLSCPEIRGLINHQGPDLYAAGLPWAADVDASDAPT